MRTPSAASARHETLVFSRPRPCEFERARPVSERAIPGPPVPATPTWVGVEEVRRPISGPRRVHALPAPDALRRARQRRARAARIHAAGPCRARRQPRDRHQRRVGRAPARRRPRGRGRRRCGRMPGRVAGRAHPRLRRRAHRPQPGARRRRARSGCAVCEPGHGGARARRGAPRQRRPRGLALALELAAFRGQGQT